MKNLEGTRILEIKESELEKKSISVNDDYNFDDCALTETERLQKLKENLSNDQKNNQQIDDFDDCALTETERLQKLKENLCNNQQIDDFDDYEDCRKISR
jgi:hypothetical protein